MREPKGQMLGTMEPLMQLSVNVGGFIIGRFDHKLRIAFLILATTCGVGILTTQILATLESLIRNEKESKY